MVDKWLADLKQGKILSERDLKSLCEKVKEIMIEESNVQPISAPVIVCGDIHGQFYDLLRIFEILDYPPKRTFLFMGDYVDRGKQSLETICLLLAYKIKYPENFFLTRGNNESASINRIYGFYDESPYSKSFATDK